MPAAADPLTTHPVVLSRTWTPAVLAKMTGRIDPHRGISVKAVYRHEVPRGNPKGWWFQWNDPTRNSQAEGMLDYWTAEILGRIYRARRASSAPKLSGIQLQTRVPSMDTDWAAGENSLFWGRAARTYEEARPTAIRARVERRAPKLGVKIRSFRMPRLDGIVAPVVTLQVSDLAKFKRWYTPGCAEGWLLGPRAGTNGSPYYGFFLSVVDSSGNWIYSMAATPNEAGSASSPERTELFPPPVATGQVGGPMACPARFGNKA